jgi:hypothetical protein
MKDFAIRDAADFDHWIRLGETTESLALDFKEKIDGRSAPDDAARKRAQQEVCRDIAQFANTHGGVLLVGVAERQDPKTGLKVADRITPVTDPDALREWIEQAVLNYLVPSTLTHEVAMVRSSGGVVVAVNVDASRRLVSVWDSASGTIECVRRTSHGKARMNPDEVERHMMNGSRAAQLALREAKKGATSEDVELAGGVWGFTGVPGGPVPRLTLKAPIRLGEVNDTSFQLRIPISSKIECVAVPFELMRAAWVTAENKIGIALSARLACSSASGGLVLDPV